jgi:hypothetical protein
MYREPVSGLPDAKHARPREQSRTMRGIIGTLSCLCMIAAAAPAYGQAKISQYNAWGTFSYQAENGKVCYVLSVPKAKQPSTLDHGDTFFLVSQRPGQNIVFEPQFRAGYNLQDNSKVTVTIGDKSFTLSQLNRPGASAWLENPAEEPQVIAAMRGGSTMQVQARSGRGNATSYEFSLQGITAALNSIQNCR